MIEGQMTHPGDVTLPLFNTPNDQLCTAGTWTTWIASFGRVASPKMTSVT